MIKSINPKNYELLNRGVHDISENNFVFDCFNALSSDLVAEGSQVTLIRIESRSETGLSLEHWLPVLDILIYGRWHD